MQAEDQERVVGQVVLALRASRLLTGARDVEYRLDEPGTVVVDWVSGPRADEVAAGLVAYGAAGLLKIDAVAPTTPSGDMLASLLVSGIPVLLRAYEPIGLEAAGKVSQELRRAYRAWTWPSPLEEDGAARDTVLWTMYRGHGMVATVVRLPIDKPDYWWTESSVLVALPSEDAPSGLWQIRQMAVDNARRSCTILLRQAPSGWTTDQADDWMDSELNGRTSGPREVTAVVWGDRCVVRTWSGLRMEASSRGTSHTSWSHVPSTLMSSLWDPEPCRTEPPTSIKVRVFGRAFNVATVSVATTWGPPSLPYCR